MLSTRKVRQRDPENPFWQQGQERTVERGGGESPLQPQEGRPFLPGIHETAPVYSVAMGAWVVLGGLRYHRLNLPMQYELFV